MDQSDILHVIFAIQFSNGSNCCPQNIKVDQNIYPVNVKFIPRVVRILKTIKSHINDKLTTNQQKEFRDFSFVNDELFNSTVSDLAENLTSAL